MDLSRRSFLAATGVLLGTGLSATPGQRPQSLKDAYRNAFLIGTALDFRSANEFDPAELDLITSQFNVITPENSMKPGNRVTFWGLNDRRSWRAGQSPLVFDRDNQPKPALQAIVAAVSR